MTLFDVIINACDTRGEFMLYDITIHFKIKNYYPIKYKFWIRFRFLKIQLFYIIEF